MCQCSHLHSIVSSNTHSSFLSHFETTLCYCRSGRLKINNLQSLVLDEFDALLEYKPHREPTTAILQTMRRRHGTALQSILCSATASDLMDSPKVTEYLRPGFATALADDDDVFVTGSDSKRPQVSKTVIHGVVHVPHRRFVLDTIRRILHTEPVPQQILIFVESAHKVEIVVDKLDSKALSPRRSMEERTAIRLIAPMCQKPCGKASSVSWSLPKWPPAGLTPLS